MNTKEILEHIQEEISRLQRVKALLQGSNVGSRSASTHSSAPKTGKRILSPQARKKIADAQRKRWAKVRKAAV